jgi:uncharacterized protein
MSLTTNLTVRVAPSARRSEVTGWTADEKGRPVLLVKLAAPPVDGKANVELIRFLAEQCSCAKTALTLLRGTSGKLKVIQLPEEAALHLQKL